MNKLKKNIYIPIEIYYREFYQKLYLISKVIKHDYRVYIGSKFGIDKILDKKIKKNSLGGIFFYKGIIIQNKKYWKKIHKSCDNFVALDEELGPAVLNKNLSLKIRGVFDNRIDKFFVIGKIWKDKILQKDKRFKKIVSVTGWPKYDLIKDRKFQFYKEQSNDIKKKFGKFYLYSSNYGTLSRPGLKKMMDLLKKNYSKNFCNQRKKIFEQNLADFKEFIHQLKIYYKNKNAKKIIIRPHPSEFYHQDWKDNVKNISDKISIVYKGDMIPWILASEGLIHRGCSTSIDAFILKKNIYYLNANRRIQKSEKNLTFCLSKKISKLDQIKDEKFQGTINKNKLISEIENFKKEKSYNKILKEISKLKTKKEEPIEPEKSMNFFNKIFFVLKKLFKVIIQKNQNQKMPHDIKESDIKYFFKNLQYSRNIKINKINEEAFEIDLKR